MRKFHNFMKDTPAFQAAPEGHQELRFKPFSAWLVFTDLVSHACVEGQFAFIDTFIVPLANCELPERAPINLLQRSAEPTSVDVMAQAEPGIVSRKARAVQR
jgi:hypothetical protein